MPIKYMIGDYFTAVIQGMKYIFSTKGQKYKYYDTAVKSFEIQFFDTSHYNPVDFESMEELEQVVTKNSLPRFNMTLLSILKIFGQKEKSKFESHQLIQLKEWLENEKKKPDNRKNEEFIEEAENIINYMDHLSIDEVVTPVKKITQFLEDDLIATDPKYPGTVWDKAVEAEIENRKINNVPIKSKTAWLKWIAIFAVTGLVIMGVYLAYDAGVFDSVVKPLEGIGDIDFNIGSSASSSELIKKYPTPEDMKCAIVRGDITINSIPAEMKPLVNSAECTASVQDP